MAPYVDGDVIRTEAAGLAGGSLYLVLLPQLLPGLAANVPFKFQPKLKSLIMSSLIQASYIYEYIYTEWKVTTS